MRERRVEGRSGTFWRTGATNILALGALRRRMFNGHGAARTDAAYGVIVSENDPVVVTVGPVTNSDSTGTC
jgi:hypothetical protein